MRKIHVITALVLLIGLVQAEAPAGAERLKLATTTSTDNSGLLTVLNRPFEEMFGVKVDVIAVGTGKAFALARNGDVDVLLVHDREGEEEFVAEGYGINRRDVMYNDFVILGPSSDPSGINAAAGAVQAMKKIAASRAPFVSRGDDSGTHRREKNLWEEAGEEPAGEWYLSVGQGMGASLTLADEKGAYVLSDRGTFLAYSGKIDLVVLVDGDDMLYNPYGAIAVNQARWAQVKYPLAMAYIGWITSNQGQRIIREFKVNETPLFFPISIP